MKNICALLFFCITLMGCHEPVEFIHIELPSRERWIDKFNGNPIETNIPLSSKYILTWSNPTNDFPPRYIQIVSSWGVVNKKIIEKENKIIISKEMFCKKNRSNFKYTFFLNICFASHVYVTNRVFGASQVYYKMEGKVKKHDNEHSSIATNETGKAE